MHPEAGEDQTFKSRGSLIKKKKKLYKEIQIDRFHLVIYEKGLPNILGKAQIFNHL
jgi:hypothetical protein